MEIEIYKLKYTDKEVAISDLIAKNVIDEEGNNFQGTHAVVDIGFYEEIEGYHFDVMSENIIDFGDKRIEVNNPKHTFGGY